MYTRHLCIGYTSSRLNAQNSIKFGLNKNKKEIEKIVACKDLKKLLIDIWAEGNILYQTEWLKVTVQSWAHPLLYLEFYFSLLQKIAFIANQEEINQLCIEAEAARLLGRKLSIADANCYKDATVLKVVKYAQEKYFPINSTVKNFLQKNDNKKKVQNSVNERLKVLLQNPIALSDPIWVSKEPLGIFWVSIQNPFREGYV